MGFPRPGPFLPCHRLCMVFAEHLLVKQVVEAAKRLYSKPRSPRNPVNVETLSQIVSAYGGPQASLSDLRICFIFLVGFAGFLRCDELIHIQRRDITVFHDHMIIHIPHRKNDQYNEGHNVFIASGHMSSCPY